MCTRLRCEDRVPASVRLCTHDCVRPCCVLLRGWHSTKCNRFIDQCATPAGRASTTARIRPGSLEQVSFGLEQSSSEGRIECVRALADGVVLRFRLATTQSFSSHQAPAPPSPRVRWPPRPITRAQPPGLAGPHHRSPPPPSQPDTGACTGHHNHGRPVFCAMSPRALLN